MPDSRRPNRRGRGRRRHADDDPSAYVSSAAPPPSDSDPSDPRPRDDRPLSDMAQDAVIMHAGAVARTLDAVQASVHARAAADACAQAADDAAGSNTARHQSHIRAFHKELARQYLDVATAATLRASDASDAVALRFVVLANAENNGDLTRPLGPIQVEAQQSARDADAAHTAARTALDAALERCRRAGIIS